MGERWPLLLWRGGGGNVVSSSSVRGPVLVPAATASLSKPQEKKNAFVRRTTTTSCAAGGAAAGAEGVAVAAAAPCVVVAASQHYSSARIEKSNRRSRFGEPLATTDSDDEDLSELLCSSVEMEDLAQVVEGRKTLRKMKKGSRNGARRFESPASPQVMAQTQQGGTAAEVKQLVRSDGPSSSRKENRATGILQVKSSMAHKLQVPPADDTFLRRKKWEEQAYQIIRQQKLRDAALAIPKGRMSGQGPKQLVGKNTIETLARTSGTSTNDASLGQPSPVLNNEGGAGMRDVEFSCMSEHLNLEDKWQPLVEYLHTLGLEKGDFIRLVDRHKPCLQANVNMVKERVEFLLTVGVQFKHLRKLIVRHPQILEYRVEQALRPRVLYLKSLGLDESKVGKIITVSPSILDCNLNRSIKPRVTYLIKSLGIKPQDIGKIIMRSPQILTQSIEDSLEPRVVFFLNVVKLPKEALAKMVTRHPQLLHYSLKDGIRPRIKFLQRIGMRDNDVLKVLTRLTQILSLSVENCLQPKYQYLVKELKGDVQTVISFPAYFSLSLDQRIIPRHMYLKFLGRSPKGPFPMRLLALSDLAFCKWAKSSVEGYDKFRHELRLSTFAKNFEQKNNVRI